MKHTSVIKLALLSAFCCVLEAIRIHITGTASYMYLPWNLVLAWIPLIFAVMASKAENKYVLSACLFAWLIFFPNAPYIITDLLHLKPRTYFPMWFDCIMLYSFAFTGFVLGMFSVMVVYIKLKKLLPKWLARTFMLCSFLLSGYAVYLGRFLRWNSWDIILNPLDILSDTLNRLIHPFQHQQAYGITLVTGCLLCIVFLLFESFTVKEEL